jgi:hypothetical protein
MAGDDRVKRRLERAEETKAALTQVQRNRSAETVAALHRLHARHLREDGDLAAAARAEARAHRAEAPPRIRSAGESPE